MEEGSNYLVIGGTSLDIVDGVRQLGGSAYYASLALIHLGIKPTVITNTSILGKVFTGSVRVISPPDGSEIIYEIKELSAGRELKLVKCSSMELFKLLKNLSLSSPNRVKGVIVSPIACELSVGDLSKLVNLFPKADVISIDIQGFVREFRRNGDVETNYARFYELVNSLRRLGRKYILKGDIKEYPPLSREAFIRNCMSEGFKGIIIRTNAGNSLHVYNCRDKEFYALKPLPEIQGEEIGTGDVFTAVLTYFLGEGENLLYAVSKASVAGGLKVARPQPPWFTPTELELLKDKVLITLQRLR